MARLGMIVPELGTIELTAAMRARRNQISRVFREKCLSYVRCNFSEGEGEEDRRRQERVSSTLRSTSLEVGVSQ